MVDSQVGYRLKTEGLCFGDVVQPHGLSMSTYGLCTAENEQKFDAFFVLTRFQIFNFLFFLGGGGVYQWSPTARTVVRTA